VVDDEPGVRSVLSQMLQTLGYEVTECATGAEALRVFGDEPDRFDAVLTDQSMPGGTGLSLAEDLLARRPDLPVVLATGFAADITEDLVRERGLVGLLMKPYRLQEVGAVSELCFSRGHAAG
jgi:CheY-like chemotaxis protein